MTSHGLMKSVLIALVLLGFALEDSAFAASERLTSDIVYSARYYKPGKRRSYYKIWRINSNGSRRVKVTSGRSNDYSPVWLADAKTILFVRKTVNSYKLCTVHENGGPVTVLSTLPKGYTFLESVAPNRSSVVYLVRDQKWKLVLFDVATRHERSLDAGYQTAWSPDSRLLYITEWGESKTPARILDLETGSRLQLSGDLRAATWLNNHTLAAEKFTKESQQARLVILHDDGTKEREVLLPFTWEDENDDFSPFADNLFAIPGDAASILYGRHAGNSTAGPAQKFYQISLAGGQPTPVAKGHDLAWSSNHRRFVTGGGRYLARLDRKRRVWVSPLSVVSLVTGKVRKLVRGKVSVGGFDWRSPQRKNK